jgi:TBC1 domain family member 10
MNDSPCHMRGLFGKGMAETHKVLHVAEKLIHHFLPKLAKHMDKENVHVTMYATQWLLTQFTSSFNFDLVTRVWDCFLVEGFKTIYRVMLAILQHVQPILLKKSFEEILGFFRDLPDQVIGNDIMEAAMKIPLKRKHITKYENEWLAEQKSKSGSS